jgi:hypothetical protein
MPEQWHIVVFKCKNGTIKGPYSCQLWPMVLWTIRVDKQVQRINDKHWYWEAAHTWATPLRRIWLYRYMEISSFGESENISVCWPRTSKKCYSASSWISQYIKSLGALRIRWYKLQSYFQHTIAINTQVNTLHHCKMRADRGCCCDLGCKHHILTLA